MRWRHVLGLGCVSISACLAPAGPDEERAGDRDPDGNQSAGSSGNAGTAGQPTGGNTVEVHASSGGGGAANVAGAAAMAGSPSTAGGAGGPAQELGKWNRDTPGGTVVWKEGFEMTLQDWSVEGGGWSFGAAQAAGAPPALAGSKVAGVGLASKYPPNLQARLVTPEITVDSAEANPRFRYRSWYSVAAGESGQLQIRLKGQPWQSLPPELGNGETVGGESNGWSQRIVDLSAFAGRTVQLSFLFRSTTAAVATSTGIGWFIDDVAVEKGSCALRGSEGFEAGYGDWSVQGGTWALGKPALVHGPGMPASGQMLAGTAFSKPYSGSNNARLVSPLFRVPPAAENPRARFQYWNNFGTLAYGQVHIRARGGIWESLPGDKLTGSSLSWLPRVIDLTPYAGQTIQLGFYFKAETAGGDATGWFIDELILDHE